MTEKQYGGAKGFGAKKIKNSKSTNIPNAKIKNKENKQANLPANIEDYRKAGKIASEIKDYAKKIIKKDVLLADIAEKIENEILRLGGEIAFPVNLSINEIAAHNTPSLSSQEKAHGLLKIDLGVHINGCIADTAFSIDLENSPENQKIIEASESALKEAIKIIKNSVELREIGKKIQETIKSYSLSPVINLAGHELSPYTVHAGISIPNYDNNNSNKLTPGFYAIEPFATNGEGRIYEGGPSGVFRLNEILNVRDTLSREIIKFIEKEYRTLPFSSRIIEKKFGKRASLALNFLKSQNIIKEYPHLIEKAKGKVSQAEHTIYFDGETAEVLT